MTRRTILMLIAVLGLSASPRVGLAQSNQWIGTWKLNLAKSTFGSGAPPISQTSTVEAVGRGLKISNDGVDAKGNPAKNVVQLFNDGQSHPVTGAESVLATLTYDAISDKEVNNSTWWDIRTKAGKVVQVVVNEMAPDGKTWTLKIMGVTPNGPVYTVLVRDKQ
jgi:hypothetical protein